jgi:hypothetical protein
MRGESALWKLCFRQQRRQQRQRIETNRQDPWRFRNSIIEREKDLNEFSRTAQGRMTRKGSQVQVLYGPPNFFNHLLVFRLSFVWFKGSRSSTSAISSAIQIPAS